MLVIGFVFCLGMVLLPLQLGLLVHDLIDDGLGGDDLARRLLLHRVDRMLLIAIPLLGIPGVTIGGISAVRAQAALITHLSPESGEALRESGSWSVWRFPLSFILFNIMSVGWTFQGFYSQSVVWSGVKYTKQRGSVHNVEMLQKREATLTSSSRRSRAWSANGTGGRSSERRSSRAWSASGVGNRLPSKRRDSRGESERENGVHIVAIAPSTELPADTLEEGEYPIPSKQGATDSKRFSGSNGRSSHVA